MNKKINLLIAFNLLIAAGLIVLYILFFSQQPKAKSPAQSSEMENSSGNEPQIGYVNTDSILNKYELVKIMEAKLEGEGEAMKKELERRQRQLEQKYMNYQKQVKNNTISIDQAKKTEEALKREQQQLYSLQQEYASRFADQQVGMNKELIDTVRSFLHRYNKKKNFDLILAKSATKNNVLFARDSFNITSEVVKKMNKEYRKRKQEAKE